MERLRGLDQVAYVRFASVYREFKDAHEFLVELEPILAHRSGRARTTTSDDNRRGIHEAERGFPDPET